MIAGELAQSSVYLSNCSTGVRSFGAASALVQYVRKNKVRYNKRVAVHVQRQI